MTIGIGENPHSTHQSYQDCLKTMHPSEEKYTDVVNEFFDHMGSIRIHKLNFGYAYCPVRGVHRLRHLTAVMENADLVEPDSPSWPFLENDFRISMNHNICKNFEIIFKHTDFCSMTGALWVCNVPRRLFKEESTLFITEPELKDDWGNEVNWNMNTEF